MSDDFVGRETELSAIWHAMAPGGTRSITLIGAAGVGKTRIARAVLDRAAGLGRAVFWVAATASASTIPFGAVSHLVPDVAGLDRFQLLRRTAAWMATRPGTVPPVVVVDDAQRLDDASAALIHHLAVTGTAFIVSTVRASDTAPDAITAIWKDGLGERLTIGPFTRLHAEEFVGSLLGGPLDPVSAAKLWHLSEGNALFVRELVRGGIESGELSCSRGSWRWSGPVSAAPRLIEFVAQRLTGASRDVRRLVDLVAFGEPLGVETITRAGIRSPTVSAAEKSGLVRSEATLEGIVIRLGHPLYGEVARSLSTSLQRAAVAQTLLRSADPAVRGEQILRRAVWHLMTGVPSEPHVLVQGAIRSLAALDLEMATRLADAAVKANGGVAAETVLARTLVLRGSAAAGEALLAEMEKRELPDRDRAELAAARAWNLVFGLKRPADAESVLDRAEHRIVQGRDVIAVQRANIRTYAGLPEEAVAAAAGIAEDGGGSTAATVVRKWVVYAEAMSVQGRINDALKYGRQAVALNRGTSHGDWSMSEDEAESAFAGALIMSGGLSEAEGIIETAYARAVEAGWRIGTGMWSVWRGELGFARGRPATAAKHYRTALAVVGDDSHPYREWSMRFAWDHLARAAAQLNDSSLAAAAFASANRYAWPGLGALDVWGGSTAGWVAVAKGEIEHGISLALAAADRAQRDRQSGWELLALHQAVRFGGPWKANGRLAELAAEVDGPLTDLYVRHGAALAADDSAALGTVADQFHSCGYVLLAAEAAAQSSRAHARAGRTSAAAEASRRARGWAAHCEGARTPALDALCEPARLTRRETEIARLVAAGLTNRSIAGKLVISIRTVDNTVAHIYDKLAVSRRQELAGIFSRENEQHSAHDGGLLHPYGGSTQEN
ncbi:LuxR C-terminal-related transcriptional regulator [Arthrobacter sp. A5]|uniref:LuxR C-terminal-related transcriptional regulator n=1 Tax=Arthrobacter sp. A5 TaxID=576926 RepID=UPI003DA86881